MARITDRVTCRQVLNFMVILGFMFNYMLRVNLTIAIVDMVVQPPADNSTTAIDGEALANLTATTPTAQTMDFDDTFRNSSAFVDEATATVDQGNKYSWNKYEQNYVLGCFFWGYVLTELPGGRLAEVIGARRVFGYSMLAASLITLLTPLACNWSIYAVIVLRVLLGLFLGATWPAMPPMAAKWIPPMERSKFIANMMASSLGAAITMPVCGFLIAYCGWPSVFYSTGIIGLIWSICWFLVVFDSPAEHPRISIEERQYIENEIAKGNINQGKKPSRVPWGQILTSGPVWAIVITHGCSVFGYFTVVNQLPTYMKDVLHFNIKKNGILSSFPYFGKYAMAVLAAWLADHLRKTGRLTTTATRKIFTTFAVLLPGFLMILQANFGLSAAFSVTIFTCALTINGAVTAGYLANALDIAPNFSGTIFGMANTLSSIGGFMSAFMVAALTNEDSSFSQWRWVFWILCFVYLFGGYHYLLLGSGEQQPWNSVQSAVWDNNGEKQDNEWYAEQIPLNKEEKLEKPEKQQVP